jgi:hypothetical protein
VREASQLSRGGDVGARRRPPSTDMEVGLCRGSSSDRRVMGGVAGALAGRHRRKGQVWSTAGVRRCWAFLLLVRAPATSWARWLGWCQSRVAASQQNAASSRAQAIAMTPAGSRRSSCGCAQRWCRRCLGAPRVARVRRRLRRVGVTRHQASEVDRRAGVRGAASGLRQNHRDRPPTRCSFPDAQRPRRASRALDAMLTSDPSR